MAKRDSPGRERVGGNSPTNETRPAGTQRHWRALGALGAGLALALGLLGCSGEPELGEEERSENVLDPSDPPTPTLASARLEGGGIQLRVDATALVRFRSLSPGATESDDDIGLRTRALVWDDRSVPIEGMDVSRSSEGVELVTDRLTERWEWREVGVEQTFIVPPPEQPARTLRIEMEVHGGRVEPSGDGAVVLVSTEGRVRYSQARAWDAQLRPVDVRIEGSDTHLALVVTDLGTVSWPLTVDPLVTTETSFNPPAGYVRCGQVGVAADGPYVAFACADGGAVPGLQYINFVFVYRRDAGGWTLDTALPVPSHSTDANNVGGARSIALSGTTLAVGYPQLPVGSGAAYTRPGGVVIYERGSGGWSEGQRLVLGDAMDIDWLGESLDLDGDRLVAGNRCVGPVAGRPFASVWVRASGTWSEEQRLLPAGVGCPTNYPSSVAISGDTVLVGGVGFGAGVPAYFWQRTAGGWVLDATPSSPSLSQENFGYAVDLDGDRAVVTEYGLCRAHTYQRSAGTWTAGPILEPGSCSSANSLVGLRTSLVGNFLEFGRTDRSLVYVWDSSAWQNVWSVTRTGFGQTAELGGDPIGLAWAAPSMLGPGTIYVDEFLGLDEGDACSGDLDCASGLCVDGVCCNTACGGGASDDCMACSAIAGAAVDGTCSPLSLAVAPTRECRPSEGACDPAETCSHLSLDCPADVLDGLGTECRLAVAGGCDTAETCDGATPECPADQVEDNTTVCRAAIPGGCDIEETCDGSSPSCPSDAVVSASTVCRPAAPGGCDVAENCDGSTVTCPSDALRSDGSSCADSVACNGAETCASGTCITASVVDCEDSNPCTADACEEPGGSCSHTPVAGCCVTAAACDDGDPCTTDRCGSAMSCAHTPITGCMDDAGVSGTDAGASGDADAGGAMMFADASMVDGGGTSAGDGGGADAGGSVPDGGCSCRAASRPASGGGAALVLGLLGMALLQRRRVGGAS